MVVLLVCLLTGLKVQAQGWVASFGGNKDDSGQSVIQTKDLGYIAIGSADSFGEDNDGDIYAVRTDVDGNLCWERVFDEGFTELGAAICPTEDNNFLIVGSIITEPGDDFDLLVIKFDNSGKLIWSKEIGAEEFRELASDISPTNDGGYIITGEISEPQGDKKDVLVVKIDAHQS